MQADIEEVKAAVANDAISAEQLKEKVCPSRHFISMRLHLNAPKSQCGAYVCLTPRDCSGLLLLQVEALKRSSMKIGEAMYKNAGSAGSEDGDRAAEYEEMRKGGSGKPGDRGDTEQK